MRLAIIAAFFLLLVPGQCMSCRAKRFSDEELLAASKAIGIGVITGVYLREFETALLKREHPQWPGAVLHEYEIRVAIEGMLLGESAPVLTTPASGCPPPFAPGDRVVAFVTRGGIWLEPETDGLIYNLMYKLPKSDG